MKESKQSISITDEMIGNLALHSPLLQELHLGGGMILSDQSVKTLSDNCRALHALSLCHTNISDQALATIGEKYAENLCSLTLFHAGEFSVDGLRALKKCSKMTHFKFLSNEPLTDDLVDTLASCWPNLEALEICAARITDGGIKQLFKQCPQLQVLKLDNLIITEACLKALGASLQEMDFGYSCCCDLDFSIQELVDAFIEQRALWPNLRK